MLHLQHHRRVGLDHGLGLGVLVDHAAHHHVDDVVLGALLGDQRAHVAAVAHHGDPVGDDLDLVHAVGDVNDAQLLVPKVADDLEKLRDLRLGQGGGGLVEYDDLGLMADGLGDFAHLLLAHGEVAHLLGGVDVDAQLVKQLAGLLVHFGVVDQSALHELPADEDILRHGQVVHHVQLLVNDHDARLLGLAGIVEFHLPALVGDDARILGIDAGEHLHQRGLARAVFTHQRVHLALAHLQIHVVQRMHAGKRFVDALHRQYDLSHDISSVS